jgi:hypothetical protein
MSMSSGPINPGTRQWYLKLKVCEMTKLRDPDCAWRADHGQYSVTAEDAPDDCTE